MARAPKLSASKNAPAESPAKPQGEAGGVAAPNAAGGGADLPAVVAGMEFNGAGAGTDGGNPGGASVAVGDAAQQPSTPSPAEVVAQAATASGSPAAHDAAGINEGAQPGVRVILLCNVERDGQKLREGSEPILPADVARQLVATGAAELDD
jgi:hypothetical protein